MTRPAPANLAQRLRRRKPFVLVGGLGMRNGQAELMAQIAPTAWCIQAVIALLVATPATAWDYQGMFLVSWMVSLAAAGLPAWGAIAARIWQRSSRTVSSRTSWPRFSMVRCYRIRASTPAA